jgi:RsmE family RNA methyltransferase
MNLVLVDPREITADGTVILDDRRSEHIVRVLGCKPGDSLRAGIINGPIGTGEIMSVEEAKGEHVRVTLRFIGEEGEIKKPTVDLILGLVRPIMLKKILAQAASLGVGRIFLINANRVEKSFFGASLLREENYRPYLLHGLEQAKDTFMPHVSVHERFKPFVEDLIPTIAGSYSRMLVAHPEVADDLKQAVGTETDGRILLAIGPEGGWVDFEIAKFTEQGFVVCNIGKRVLRTDTAVVALLAQLMLLQSK